MDPWKCDMKVIDGRMRYLFTKPTYKWVAGYILFYFVCVSKCRCLEGSQRTVLF